MTEQEYIDVQALTEVRMIRAILHDVLSKSVSFISTDDYATVRKILRQWEESGFESIECETVSDDSQH